MNKIRNEGTTKNSIYKKALQKFSSLFNNAVQKDRYEYVYPLVCSGMSRSHAVELGIRVTTYKSYLIFTFSFFTF